MLAASLSARQVLPEASRHYPRGMELREDMSTGKASDAKAAEGDAPVFHYIASLPQPQRATRRGPSSAP